MTTPASRLGSGGTVSAEVAGESVWQGRDYLSRETFARPLTPEMVMEIVSTTRALAGSGLTPRQMTPGHFPLPVTGALLSRLYRDVDAGPGFALLTGFPTGELNEDEVRLAYSGVCSHFGRISLQNREGEYLLEVTDKGKGYDESSRGYHSNAHLDYHNDGTNTVSLLCMQDAVEGGRSMLVSGPAVYNEILRSRPDLLAPLLRGFHHHRRDQREAGDAPVTPYRTPVFDFRNGLFHMAYAGPSITFCEQEGVVLSDLEKEALAYLETVIQRPELSISMELRPGDIQFVNNFLVLHARTAYRDAPDRRRRLLRLWLDDENSARLGPGKMDWYLPEHSRFTLSGGIDSLEQS